MAVSFRHEANPDFPDFRLRTFYSACLALYGSDACCPSPWAVGLLCLSRYAFATLRLQPQGWPVCRLPFAGQRRRCVSDFAFS